MKLRCSTFNPQARSFGKLIAAVAAFGQLWVGAAALAESAPVVSKDKTFTFRVLSDPETLDWNKAHTPIETNVLINLMEGLVTFGSDQKVIPALAEKWEVSPDQRTYTFHLRKNVRWSDGVPLKAQDFVFSWKRLLSPVTAASYAYLLFDIEGAEAFNKGTQKDFETVGVKALDDQTLKVKLAQPVSYWLYIPTFWVTFPLRQDVVEKNGNNWDKPGKMVTLGPYQLESREVDNRIVLKANPNYYGSKGNIEQVVALVVKDDSTALTLYETGRFDFLTDLSSLDLKRLQGRADLRTFPYFKTTYLGFTTTKFPFNNPKLRRALAMAIDRRKIPSILYGGQTATTSFLPPKMLGYSPDVGLKFNPLEAKSELRLSGWDPSHPLSIELLSMNWDKILVLAEFIQGEFKRNLGVDVTLQPFDHKTFRAQLALNAFPLFINSWSGDYPDPDNFMSVFLGGSGNNHVAWKNKKYDDLVLESRHLKSEVARQKNYRQAEKILLEDEAAIVPLFNEPNTALVRPRVKGLELNPLNYLYLRSVNVGAH